MSRPEHPCHAKIAQSQQRRTFLPVIIAYIILTEILHVMHIHAHIMSKSVRHEKAGNTFCNHLIHISTHKAQAFQPLKHMPYRGKMHIVICDARARKAECQFIGALNNVIYLALM